VFDRPHFDNGAARGIAEGQTEVDGQIEQLRSERELLKRPLVQAVANDRAEA
jgi:hypothetical protein